MDLNELTKKIDHLIYNDGSITNSVHYKTYCKLVAQLCFEQQPNSRNDGIYYLSESHGVALREKCYRRSVFNDNGDMFRVMEEYEKKTKISTGLNFEYISFQSAYAEKKYEGLQNRLKEMPKEWTIVQITLPFDTKESWNLRLPNSVVDVKGLHIVKFNCGDTQDPCHVYIPVQSTTDEGTESILGLLHKTVLDKSLHKSTHKRQKTVRERRLNNCEILKKLVNREIVADWLREWCFMLLGKICNPDLERSIKDSIDQVFTSSKTEISSHDRNLIYQLAYGCAHIQENVVGNTVAEIIGNTSLTQKYLTEQILKIRDKNCTLINVRRHPVILVIDEKLECVPWEMLPILKKHPVSRVNSVHFAHALYKSHENSIVNGNKIITNTESGYYIVNPDLSLQNTEERIKQFLDKRFSQWCGVVGTTPTKDQFNDALTDYNILLYCGHGSGAQYMSTSRLNDKNVKALPLLFGCSSVEHKDYGGRIPFSCHADALIAAASPCVLGMLWQITSKDADNMALALLNHWLPGNPVVLEDMNEVCDAKYQEPELLRALKVARDVAALYFNSCAMVVYGIPVIVK